MLTQNFKILTHTLLLSTLLFAACSGSKEVDKEATTSDSVNENVVVLTDAQLKHMRLEVGGLSDENISETLKLNGHIDVPPRSMVSVPVPMGGYLLTTDMLPGAYVAKGQTIAMMQDQQYIQLQEDYLTAQSSLSYTQSDFKRQKALNQDQATSDKQYQLAKRSYETDQIRVRALAEKLKLINVSAAHLSPGNIRKTVPVFAPITGYVYRVNANVGSYVNSGNSLFEIINTDDVHLTLKVFEKDLNTLRVGQKVMVYTNEDPYTKYPCHIILISHALGEDKSAEVHCHFEKYDNKLKPGMYMNAEVEVTRQIREVLPEEAVVRFENQDFVFLQLDPHRYEMTPMQTEMATENKMVPFDAASWKGKAIVTKGAYTLLMALKNKAEEE